MNSERYAFAGKLPTTTRTRNFRQKSFSLSARLKGEVLKLGIIILLELMYHGQPPKCFTLKLKNINALYPLDKPSLTHATPPPNDRPERNAMGKHIFDPQN